jgi:hypothetical protein
MTLQLGMNGKPPRNYASFEHLIRKRDGGTGRANNIVLACVWCNNHREDGYQLSLPNSNNIMARRVSNQELMEKAKQGLLNRAEYGQLFVRGLVPNWPMWFRVMGDIPL